MPIYAGGLLSRQDSGCAGYGDVGEQEESPVETTVILPVDRAWNGKNVPVSACEAGGQCRLAFLNCLHSQ